MDLGKVRPLDEWEQRALRDGGHWFPTFTGERFRPMREDELAELKERAAAWTALKAQEALDAPWDDGFGEVF